MKLARAAQNYVWRSRSLCARTCFTFTLFSTPNLFVSNSLLWIAYYILLIMATALIQSFFHSIEDFRYLPGQLPGGNFESVFGGIAIYLTVVFGIKYWMRDRKKFEMNSIVPLHNFFLSGLSLIMMIGMLIPLSQLLHQRSTHHGVILLRSREEIGTRPSSILVLCLLP